MKKLFPMIFAIALLGCATTDMTGFVDPRYRYYQISRVVVRVQATNLEETLSAESKVAQKFGAYNVEVIKFTDIAPPTRNHSQEEEIALIRGTGADSVFTIHIVRKDLVHSYVPPTYYGEVTTAAAAGMFVAAAAASSSRFEMGGYYVSSPVMRTFSNLVDLRNGDEIWRGEGHSSGAESYMPLLLNAAESAVKNLAEKGLLQPNEGR